MTREDEVYNMHQKLLKAGGPIRKLCFIALRMENRVLCANGAVAMQRLITIKRRGEHVHSWLFNLNVTNFENRSETFTYCCSCNICFLLLNIELNVCNSFATNKLHKNICHRETRLKLAGSLFLLDPSMESNRK